jgi:type II secretory pathway component GspD/PulD (secretin)
LLGDIPLLGSLFKRKIKSGQKTELLIFLTPHIVQAPTQLAAITEVEKQRAVNRSAFSEKELDKLLETIPSVEGNSPSPKK